MHNPGQHAKIAQPWAATAIPAGHPMVRSFPSSGPAAPVWSE
ncbi:hypothetical protein CJ469_00003 [Nocardia farcinica]|nr:hypothetical protein CJ469_00003 [Nocardia farcinica]PFX09815.1 hypothetical protein CJ468_01655 [Nocardia farcinica]